MLFQIALFWNDVILILVCLYKFYLPYLRWKHNYVKRFNKITSSCYQSETRVDSKACFTQIATVLFTMYMYISQTYRWACSKFSNLCIT